MLHESGQTRKGIDFDLKTPYLGMSHHTRNANREFPDDSVFDHLLHDGDIRCMQFVNHFPWRYTHRTHKKSRSAVYNYLDQLGELSFCVVVLRKISANTRIREDWCLHWFFWHSPRFEG